MIHQQIRRYYDYIEKVLTKKGLRSDAGQKGYLIGHYAATLSMIEYAMEILQQAKKEPSPTQMRHEIDRALSFLDTVLILEPRHGDDNKDTV